VDHGLAEALVQRAGITPTDTVYEIGPGDGILTRVLAKTAHKVVAIEVDPALVTSLRTAFAHQSNVDILHADFLTYAIQAADYKIVSNVPFNITADVVKRLLGARRPPSDAHLILQREAAEKFAGQPRQTEVSLLAKPWFEFSGSTRI
jgi:23S rRNA (adenine-N6)-dimethyltransferase